MEALEYWIWEHATKYGMTKVLTQIKCSFTQTNVPNSWLSALFLQQIKDDWSKVENKINSKELNSVRQILVSTYKLFKKQLKHVIKTSEFIQLDFYCKAAFLIMRSSGSEPGMKRRVQNQIFPIWSTSLWTKTKTSFDLKDDLFMDEIKQCYTLIRMQLTHNQENEILVMFGMLMQKHFPKIISLLRKIKQSVLERLQKKHLKLDSSLEFIKPRLSCGLGNELTVLNLLEDMQRRKVLLKAVEFLKEKSILYPANTDTSLDITMYTLPPNSMFQSKDEQIYLPCFATSQHPFMPTNITLEKDGEIQEFMIKRSIPLYSDGKPFGAHWFSDSSSFVLKKEKIGPSENERVNASDVKSRTSNDFNGKITDSDLESANEEGLVSKFFKAVDTTSLDDYSEKLEPIVKEEQVAIPTVEKERVQSWIDENHDPACHSLSRNGSSVHCGNKEQQFPSSVKIIPSSTESFSTEARGLDNHHHGAVTVSDVETCPSSSPTRVEETSGTWENSSDVEGLSSTSVPSHYRNRTSRLRYLTEKSELCNKEEADCQSYRVEEDLLEGSLTDSKVEDNDYPCLRSRTQTRKQIQEESPSELNTRLRKKVRKLSSSSEKYSTASSFENRSPKKSVAQHLSEAEALEKRFGSPTKSILNSRSATDEKCRTEETPWNGTPPLEEPTSNYQTPDAQDEDPITQNLQEINVLRASIKRKLYQDREISKNSPKSKRILVDHSIDGRRILPKVLETLQKQSEELRLIKTLGTKHVEALEICIARVLSSHQKLHLTNDLTE